MEFKNIHLENVKIHNKTNIDIIKQIILNKSFIIGNNKVILNNKILLYLNNIIKYIENKMEEANNININNTSVERYRETILKYKSELLFYKISALDYKVYINIFYLFPGLKDEKNDIIFKNRKTFSDILSILIKQSGGTNLDNSNEINKLYNIDINNYQSYSEKVDKLMETNSSDALKLCLYYNFKKLEPNTPYSTIEDNIQSLYNLLFHFYDYMAMTSVNDNFIEIVINLYKTNELHNMSFEEFEKIFNDWYNNYKLEKEKKKINNSEI